MTDKEKALRYVDDHFDEMVAELARACACASFAGNPVGLDAMRTALQNDLKSSGLAPTLHQWNTATR